ncbi:histone H2A [Coprinopsis marcescibilis]|uniref:Histone H2A n=1 Tax=Coprinopsis marcescibilis TaxID=230819 RepID=A0A5C3L0L8_COPMA|nr:histone H2A [Coprinopsis marcescibilis]
MTDHWLRGKTLVGMEWLANQYGKTLNHSKHRVSLSRKAGLEFPVSRIKRKAKECLYPSHRIFTGAAVYLTAVIEYLTAEVLELAGNQAKYYKKKRIIPRHILIGVWRDTELHELLKNVDLPDSGVVPFVHEVLRHDKVPKVIYPTGPRFKQAYESALMKKKSTAY